MPKQADDDSPSALRLVLVGMMGSGKTTVGRLVAARLRVGFADTDEEVEYYLEQPVSSIFKTLGEAAFRQAEAEVLTALLAEGGPGVIAGGGGIVLEEANRAAMKRDANVVWLRTRVGTLTDRVGTGEGRPLLAGGTAKELAKIAQMRTKLYEAVADAIVDTDELAPESVADAVISVLDSLAGRHS